MGNLLKSPIIVFLLASSVFLIFCLFFILDVPMSESVWFWIEAEYLEVAFRNTWHPPIYIVLLHFFRYFFSNSYIGGYFLGILSVIASALLITKIIIYNERKIEEKTSLLMVILLAYYSLPVVLHGVFIFDIDNTILTPILLLTYFVYLKFNHQANWLNGILLSLSVLLGLWTKMTTPILIICSITFFHLLQGEFKLLIFKIIPIFGTSLTLFYLSYGWLFSKYILERNDSVRYNQGKALAYLSGLHTFNQPLKDVIFSIASSFGGIVLWSSPIIAILIVFLFINIIKDQNLLTFRWIGKSLDQRFILPAIIILAIIVSYSILIKVQATAGFPKYHYPLYSFVFIMLGTYLVQSKIKFERFDIAFFVITLIAISLSTKDILYPFYELGRERQYNQLMILFVRIGFFMFLPVIVYYLIRKKTRIKTLPDLMMVFLMFAMIVNFAGFFYRSQADYSTNYHYGIKGTDSALAYAKTIPLDQSVYFPFTGFLLDRPGPTKTAAWGRLLGEDQFKPNTNYIIITDTMLNRNKFFFGLDYVKEKYDKIKTIDSYGIWKRKNQ